MAHSKIHLVQPLQHPPKPQPVDPADIASQVLIAVRECIGALADFHEYQENLVGHMSAQLSQLEQAALRAMTRKTRRS